MSNFLPSIFDMPDTPRGIKDPEVQKWMRAMTVSVETALKLIAARVNAVILVGTDAEKPPANGSHRFYWVTDETPHLEFDNGEWTAV